MDIKKVKNEDFEPLTIQIRIDDEEELGAIQAMASQNVGIPEVVCSHYEHTVKSFLDKLREVL